MTMRCFNVAGAVRGVPESLQIVPGGNSVPPLLLVDALLDVLPLLDALPPVLPDVLAPAPLLLDVVPVLDVVLAPPPVPLEVALVPPPPQAMKVPAITGIATRQVATGSEGSFMGRDYAMRDPDVS